MPPRCRCCGSCTSGPAPGSGWSAWTPRTTRKDGLLFAIDLGQRWSALRDDDGLVSRSLGGGAPKTVFIDSAGDVVHVQRGTYRSYAALLADVRRYLGLAL